MGTLCQFGRPNFRLIIIQELAVVQLVEAIGKMEVSLVMGDDEHGLTIVFQFRQELGIEYFLKPWVLIGSPFVKDIKWTIFQISGKQR